MLYIHPNKTMTRFKETDLTPGFLALLGLVGQISRIPNMNNVNSKTIDCFLVYWREHDIKMHGVLRNSIPVINYYPLFGMCFCFSNKYHFISKHSIPLKHVPDEYKGSKNHDNEHCKPS